MSLQLVLQLYQLWNEFFRFSMEKHCIKKDQKNLLRIEKYIIHIKQFIFRPFPMIDYYQRVYPPPLPSQNPPCCCPATTVFPCMAAIWAALGAQPGGGGCYKQTKVSLKVIRKLIKNPLGYQAQRCHQILLQNRMHWELPLGHQEEMQAVAGEENQLKLVNRFQLFFFSV